MERDPHRDNNHAHRRIGRIVVRGEFGPLLSAAFPEGEIVAASGETRIAVHVRDDAELFSVLERLRDLGGELVSVSVDP